MKIIVARFAQLSNRADIVTSARFPAVGDRPYRGMTVRQIERSSYGACVGIQKTEQQVECGFRLLRGEHPGLTSRWAHGLGSLESGRVVFTANPFGLRFLTRREVIIEITVIDRASEHPADLRRIWSLSPSTRVVEVETPCARLEWALLPEVLHGVLDLVDPAFG